MLFQLIILAFNAFHFATAASLWRVVHPNAALIAGTGFHDNIMARQTSPGPSPTQVPAPCKTDCDPINAEIAKGCSPDECCQASFVQGYVNCVECVGKAANITDYTPVQTELDELTAECHSRGFNTPELTLPGIDPNRTLPTFIASGLGPSLTASFSSLPPPNLPPVTTTAGQNVVTELTGTPTPPPSTTPNAAKVQPPFSVPQFSHLSISAVLLGGLVYWGM